MIYPEHIIGEKIVLKNITLNDCTEKYVNWLNDITINEYLESRLSIQTLDSIKQFVLNIIQSSDNYMFTIIYKESNEHIGNIKIGPIHPIYGNAFIGYLIGENNYWGKGLASEAVYLASKFSFEVLNLHKINAGVIEPNLASIKVLEKLGFKKEAHIRDDVFIDNKYLDVIRYGVLKNELLEQYI